MSKVPKYDSKTEQIESESKKPSVIKDSPDKHTVTDNSGSKYNKFNLKRFLITPQLESHHKHVLQIAM